MYERKSESRSNSNIALINAGGASIAAGALTTALIRSQVKNWAHAGVLGLCAAFLTMFFMTPQLIHKAGLAKTVQNPEAEALVKDDAAKVAGAVVEHLKPAKKLVQFRQQS